MNTVTSKDGTKIAYDKTGHGPAVIHVAGAMGTRSFGFPDHARLLESHFTVYNDDRRGRGESTDTRAFAVEREVEDIEALINEAGDSASLYGISSGACLVLEAAIMLVSKVKKLALYEAPYNSDPDDQPIWHDYYTKLNELVAAKKRGDAVVHFMKFVGVPDNVIEEMRTQPIWAGLEAVAPTLLYDAAAMGGETRLVPVERVAKVAAPTLIMDGEKSLKMYAFMRTTADALAQAMPNGFATYLEGPRARCRRKRARAGVSRVFQLEQVCVSCQRWFAATVSSLPWAQSQHWSLMLGWTQQVARSEHLLRSKKERQMAEQVEVVIIGGGQAGLALSSYLTQQGRTHLVLEQGQVGETWRSGRWDSFTLNTPNWMTQLPGFAYQGDDPDGFLPREEIVDYLERYAASFHAPLHCGVRVTAVRQHPGGDGYLVEAQPLTFAARNVVLATGAFPQAKLPPASAALSVDICQMHTSEYRNPQSLPSGAVLVVGTGQSGCQIAEELHESGRQVYLSTSSCGRVPRRYRGKDSTWWLARLGFYDRTLDQLPSPTAKFACNPHVSGNQGGHDINLRQFARHGMTLLGHVQAAQGKQLLLAPDLEENLAKADAFAAQITQGIDEYITKTGMEVAANRTTGEAPSKSATPTKPLLTLDLQSAGISTIIWASGYKLDFGWVQIPVFDQAGYPVHRRGITASPGLYFLGLHWLYKTKSALLFGIGEDAAFIASAIADRG